MCEPSARPICLYGVFHVCHGPICPDRRHVRVPTLVPKCLSWYYKRAESTLALSHPLTTNRCSSTPPQTCVQIVTLSLPSPDTCVSACLRSNSPEQPDQPCLHAVCSVCVCVCTNVCVRVHMCVYAHTRVNSYLAGIPLRFSLKHSWPPHIGARCLMPTLYCDCRKLILMYVRHDQSTEAPMHTSTQAHTYTRLHHM